MLTSKILARSKLALAQPSKMLFTSACTRVYPDEPSPYVFTDFPSPKTQSYIKEVGEKTCTLITTFPIDLENSLGNIVSDEDGNKLLDIYCAIGTNAVGYNHPKFLAAADNDLMRMTIATRTGIGINPIKEQRQFNEDAFMTVAPPGMDRVTAAMCGTCANEGAYKVAMMAYQIRKNGGEYVEPTPEELCSCMLNQAPGSPDFAILSLKSGFHGRMLGAMSTSRSKPIHKVDVPAFDWPAAENPVYKYPLEDNVEYNADQDRMSLADVRAKVEQWKAEKGSEVIAVVIEPCQAEGGDNWISNEYARGLRELTLELGIFMIVDEV